MTDSIRSYPLASLRGLTSSEVASLDKVGIDSTAELLAAASTTYREQKLADQTGISRDRMREAVNRADLVQVRGIGPATADLFENGGVNSARELSRRNPTSLHGSLSAYVDSRPELNYRRPGLSTVSTLVDRARETLQPAAPSASMADTAAKHLKQSVHQFYLDHRADIPPDAATLDEAVDSVQPSRMTEVTDPDEDPYAHDLSKVQLFSHPDTVFPGSDIVWFVAFDRASGKLLEVYSFN